MYDDRDAYVAMVHDPRTDENFGKIQDHGAARGRADVDRRGVARARGVTAGVPHAAHASEQRAVG
jgi:hypothetical protein